MWGQVEIPTSANTYGATQWLELHGVLCWIEIIYRSKNSCSECKCGSIIIVKTQKYVYIALLQVVFILCDLFIWKDSFLKEADYF